MLHYFDDENLSSVVIKKRFILIILFNILIIACKTLLEGKLIFEMSIRKISVNVPKLRYWEYWNIGEIEKYWRIKNRDRE